MQRLVTVVVSLVVLSVAFGAKLPLENSGGAESTADASAGASAAAGAGSGGVAGAGAGISKTLGFQAHASVNFGGTHAGAGAGTKGGAATHAGASGGGASGGGTIFDNIFNIPISVLQSVNEYLNNRPIDARKTVRTRVRVESDAAAAAEANGEPGTVVYQKIKPRRRGAVVYKTVRVEPVAAAAATAGVQTDAGASNTQGANVDARASANAGSDAAANAGTGASAGAAATGVKKNYDGAFNIPISTLTAVNKFLNDLGKRR